MINIWATYVSIQRCLCLQYGYFIFNYPYTCFDELAACRNITESFWTYAGLLAANTVLWIKTLFSQYFPVKPTGQFVATTFKSITMKHFLCYAIQINICNLFLDTDTEIWVQTFKEKSYIQLTTAWLICKALP